MANEMSARHQLPFLAAGQAQKELTHNEALALIDFGMNATAVAAGLNEPPATPTSGQCWIIGTAPTSVWSGQPNALVSWTSSGWRFVPAFEGLRVWLEDVRLDAQYVSGAWTIGDVYGTRVIIGGQQVIGTRGAAVVAPTGGTVIDVEARAALAALLERLSGHGLIAT